MTVLRQALRIEVAILAAGFAAVLAWKIVRGAVRWIRHPQTRNVLRDGVPAVLRLQMPAASLLIALYYVSGLPRSAEGGNLPPVPNAALALMAGSQLTFLVAAARHLFGPFGMLKNNEGEK